MLIDDLRRQRRNGQAGRGGDGAEVQPDLFADFNGLPSDDARTEFYQHDANWSNRMILGDSLQVMASLAEREGLRGKVQCIYLDPPYGIKFNSNFQWSTTSRDVKDGKAEHISREPEQVKAFRDTWRDGIHSYLSYLRDRLTVARELLAKSGSIFVQISNENVHRVRCILDEVFGSQNVVASIAVKKASPDTRTIKNTFNYILWYARQVEEVKARKLYRQRVLAEGTTEDPKKLALWLVLPDGTQRPLTTDEKRQEATPPKEAMVFRADKVRDLGPTEDRVFGFEFCGETLYPGDKHCWRGDPVEMQRLGRADRLLRTRETLAYKYFLSDSWGVERTNIWEDTAGKIPDMRYVVETNAKIIARCLYMATDPGDLVLDPTCGSGTAAYVAEQWGRRWITIDTSRVALALARARIMGARYPYYLLADSPEGQRKEAEVTRKAPTEAATHGDVRQGFVYERVPHITLKSIANNAEIDIIWERWQETLEPLREDLNATLDSDWEEWEIPREASEDWPAEAAETHRLWWEARIARQQEIDASIAARADYEYLYDKPYEDGRKVRVAGPFTVESLSPHRVLAVDENDELLDRAAEPKADYGPQQDFAGMILEQLATAGGVRLFFVEKFSPYSWAFLPADASLQCSVRGDSNQASTYPRLSGGQPSLETVPNTVGLSPSGALPSGHSRGVLVRFHGQGDRPVMALTTGFQGRRFDVPEARTGVPRIDLPSPAPCAAADAVFADAKAFLSSNEARQMSESELERELHRRGQKLVRKLLQGHHDQRSPGQVAGPAEDASGVECSARREQDSHAETTSGTMQVVGLGCARRGHDGLHPLDAALNLLPERSLVDMRRRVTIATASRAPPRTPWKPQWYSTLSTWQRRCGVRCSSPSSLKACRHLARDRMVVDRRTVTLGCSCDGPQAATGRRRIDAY